MAPAKIAPDEDGVSQPVHQKYKGRNAPFLPILREKAGLGANPQDLNCK